MRKTVKCSICGGVAMSDQYGNGECRKCGWKFSKGEEELERKLGISYPMLVSPTTAREQYKMDCHSRQHLMNLLMDCIFIVKCFLNTKVKCMKFC